MIQDHPVNNESTTWNCQDWVVENLDNLEEGGLLQVSPDVEESLQGKLAVACRHLAGYQKVPKG